MKKQKRKSAPSSRRKQAQKIQVRGRPFAVGNTFGAKTRFRKGSSGNPSGRSPYAAATEAARNLLSGPIPYPWLIHKFTYRRTNHPNIHVRGYKEKGNINTPLELAIRNQVDRFNLAIDVIDRVPRLEGPGAHLKEWLKGQIVKSINFAYAEGLDKPEIRNWKWPSEQ